MKKALVGPAGETASGLAGPVFRVATSVKVWLFIGLVMIFVQIVVGGITRLTGSGLSITKWEIVTGTLPPMNAVSWEAEFELYQQTPQYQKINEGMSLSDFKFIYFWEYIHRLWARSMGLVFAIPFFIFIAKGMLPRRLIRRLGIVVLLAAVVASFGWIMVASGLVERPWVNAYKLSLHLSLALVLFAYLLWTYYQCVVPLHRVIHNQMLKRWITAFTVVLAVQIFMGGIMSGMKAGLFFPTWPDMNGEWIPDILFKTTAWNVDNFVYYDREPFMAALVQIIHRTLAYLLFISGLVIAYKAIKSINIRFFHNVMYLLVSMLVIQMLLGIGTVILCKGTVPVGWGVMHQAGAVLLLSITVFANYILRKSPLSTNVDKYVEENIPVKKS